MRKYLILCIFSFLLHPNNVLFISKNGEQVIFYKHNKKFKLFYFSSYGSLPYEFSLTGSYKYKKDTILLKKCKYSPDKYENSWVIKMYFDSLGNKFYDTSRVYNSQHYENKYKMEHAFKFYFLNDSVIIRVNPNKVLDTMTAINLGGV